MQSCRLQHLLTTAWAAGLVMLGTLVPSATARGEPGSGVEAQYANDIRPMLAEHCFDCHADGAKKGGVTFDPPAGDGAVVADHDLWARALKNVRAGLMPPPGKSDRMSADEIRRLEQWVKYRAFALDPASPDPGRVTLRRLNRVEYRNTIRDLIGVDFKADEEFPVDDSGHGFDNIGDALTVSPMLLEKYLNAAGQIVAEAVPDAPRVVAEQVVLGTAFTRVIAYGGETEMDPLPADMVKRPTPSQDAKAAKPARPEDAALALSYYEPASATALVTLDHPGSYVVHVDMILKGRNVENNFDNNRCEVAFRVDGKELLRKEYAWEEKRELQFEIPTSFQPGAHQLSIEVAPLTPGVKQTADLKLLLASAKLVGPQEPAYWVRPKNYAKFFGDGFDDVADAGERREVARKILGNFAGRAFRRPVDAPTLDRLVSLAETVSAAGKKPFEAGVRQAMAAVLASPRFLFRDEWAEPGNGAAGDRFPRIDEFSLASRLSYFLWSSMPDDELLRLAAAGELRQNQAAQVKRMLADPKASALTKNFLGQWLESRDVETVVIETRRVANQEMARKARIETDRDRRETRVAMRQEIERYFEYVLREDRPVLELVDSDYTFLNERLANYYGVPGVTGDEVRRVTLPPDSPRGGVLTTGGVLMVTSNPTRTSPVKRGLFVLENILGTPTPPPPPDIPSLEDAGKKFKDRVPTLRETLELHRAEAVCSSCHNRMDPLGLAFENFNALGIWRDKEVNQPIDAAGKLITGEKFKDIKELKRILATDRKQDVYRCMTEKLLTYALGRGLEYYDVETVDRIVAALDQNGGRFSALLNGVIECAPFQRQRLPGDGAAPQTAQTRAAAVSGSIEQTKGVTP